MTDEAVVKKVWDNYGTNDPYFGVMSNPEFHANTLSDNASKFWVAGQHDADRLKRLYEEYHTHAEGKDTIRVLDYGCGVGRLMKGWGNGVEGCDISPAYLAEARKNLGEEAVLHLIEPGDCPKGFDVIYSLIVLQHNRPILMKKCMRSIVEALNPKGLAMIHAPYFIPRVQHSDEVMEMNYVPKDEMVKEIEAVGGVVLAYDESWDGCGGDIKNLIYVIYKSDKGSSVYKRLLNHQPRDFFAEMKNMPVVQDFLGK
jgi:SAM-dependent methyltransferase